MDVRHEAFPGELDVCDVCGEVYADRLEHGHILFRGRERGPFRPRLLDLAEEYEAKFPRILGRILVGCELFNAVDMEDVPPWRMEWFVSRRSCVPLKRWQTPRHDVIHLGVGERRVWSVEPSRELPVWGVFLELEKPFLGREMRAEALREMRAEVPKQRPFNGVRVYGEGGPNRAERRGRIEANDGSGFNGTPRALRITRKRGG